MGAVAVLAEDGEGHRPGVRPAVGALADGDGRRVMAGLAGDRTELLGVREVRNPRQVGVAVDAGDPGRAVDRDRGTSAVDEEGQALAALEVGIAVADKAVVVRWLTGKGRGGAADGQGRRQQEERDYAPGRFMGPWAPALSGRGPARGRGGSGRSG